MLFNKNSNKGLAQKVTFKFLSYTFRDRDTNFDRNI